MNSDEGGDGVGKGVCGGGEDGGSAGGWGIHENPCFINSIVLCRDAYVTSLSSLRGGSISGLYLEPVYPLFLNVLPLRVAPNIKVVA